MPCVDIHSSPIAQSSFVQILAIAIVMVLSAFNLPTCQSQVSCAGQIVGAACIQNPNQTYQCIDGNFTASSLYGAQLLNPTPALTTAQFILVKGKVTFSADYTFAPGSDIVFLDNNSGFTVSGNKKLTLSSSNLHGCTKLWAGVEVLNSGVLTAQNCTFEDAKAAIILRNQTKVEITGSTFRKNVCSIIGLAANPTVTISIYLANKRGISGNSFWGNNALLESAIPSTIVTGINSDAPTSSTNFPFAGIWIERVNALTIGYASNQVNVARNSLNGFGKETNIRTQGIRSIQSNVTITNTAFSDFGFYNANDPNANIEADGVFARNDEVANAQTTLVGLNRVPNPVNTFNNCYQDIRTIGTSLNVTNMTSYRPGISVAVNMANSWQNAINCVVKNNKIDYFRGAGITIGLFKPITFNIEGNKIFGGNDATDPDKRTAISVSSNTNTEMVLADGQIYNKQIKSRTSLLSGSFWGIVLNQCSYMTIELNSIIDEQANNNLGALYGLRTEKLPCNGLGLYSNSITGAKINYAFAAGFHIRESINDVINCNETNNINMGMLFFGMCDNADLRKNKFNYHDIGLRLGHPNFDPSASIGLQSAKENRWFGTNSPIEALANNAATAAASIFEVNSSNMTSDYWPLPRKIGVNDDMGTWFKPLTGQEPSNDFSCLSGIGRPFGEGAISDTDKRLLNGTYQPMFNYPALTWEAKWKFADRLNRNPVLQNSINGVAQYYQNTVNANFNLLNKQYQDYLNRWTGNSQSANVEAYTAALSNALDQRFALDFLLSEADANNASLYGQMATADASLATARANLKAAVESMNTLVNANVNTLIANVQAVACTEVYEIDMRTVLKAIFNSHFTDNQLKPAQTTQLSAIAAKCRYAGGYAVLLARGYFAPQESYNQDINCTVTPMANAADRSLHYDDASVSLYPNPASEMLTLHLDKPIEHGTVQVFNSQGMLLRTSEIQGQDTYLQIADLPNGTYFLEIRWGKCNVHKTFIKIQ